MVTMETEFVSSESITLERPSKEFLQAVSKLLETNATDLLTELDTFPSNRKPNNPDTQWSSNGPSGFLFDSID